MSTAEIISLLASVCAAISAIAAVISCFLHYRTTKPKINIEIKQPKEGQVSPCCYVYAQFDDNKTYCFGYMRVSLYNTSSVGGTIANIRVLYEGKPYNVETIGMVRPKRLNIKLFCQDPELFRLNVPLVLPPYSAVMGYFILPDFPLVRDHGVEVLVEFTTIENKKRFKRFFPIKFDNITGNHLYCHFNYNDNTDQCKENCD